MKLYINAFKQGIARVFILPRLSLPLISTLGLTLAAVLTVVAVANTLLFKPLPDINETDLHHVELNLEFNEGLVVPFFSDIRRVASAKQYWGKQLDWGYISPSNTNVNIANNDINVTMLNASTGTPELLGLELLSGQSSTIENAEEGIWISKSLWQSVYGSASDITHMMLRVEGNDYPVFGVINNYTSINTVSVGDDALGQVWRFEALDASLTSPDTITLNLGPITVVRGPKSALPQTSDLESWFVDYVNNDITEERARDFLLSKKIVGEVSSYRDAFIGDSEQLVFVLIIAMVCLLIMACLNLLNLFIAHYQSRNKEFAIQICMGASVGKLRRLIFVENLPMFFMATLLGLISAGWLIKVLPILAGDNLPLLDQISIDMSSVLLALIFIVLINVIFATIALLYVDKMALTDSLNSSGKGTPAQQNQIISKALMVIQLSLACVLLTAASVSVIDSYNNAYKSLGYSMPNAYEVSLQVSDDTWQASLEEFDAYQGSEWQLLRRDLTERLSALGGEVFDINALPLTANVSMSAYPDPDTGESVMIRPLMWAPEMLSAFDIQLLAGRDLTVDDIDLPNVLISQSFAIERAGETEWMSMVGQEIKMGEDAEDIYKVVGIIIDIEPMPSGTLNVDAPEVYFSSPTRMSFNTLSAVVIMPEGEVLTRDDVVNLLVGMDDRLGELSVVSMDERWENITQATRLNMIVIAGLAVLTLVLAIIGVSGLSQMTAGQRSYELAVRMATGAKQIQLLQLLMKESLWILIVGLSVGAIAGVVVYQYILGMFESAPSLDWTATAIINFALALAMLVSVAIPGWRVIRKDPMRTLREL
ncbi:FtsX-like permease family protein [Alteromonas naphthalenivorans]|uniref:ABC transporter permease n=1 Tax=Alteromonas naphthalenivorans TaxID=715451 RepID=F5Z9T0_ALTNA|nr:FtsX-like permease family protein [Alteromonas naphthalenivorans]AEF02085.1 putative ABC transporter permease [Alteromonas naphthalenivorans]|tara:strand:- start:3297 stop:5765 length:2469 start_codon:yes stop_codon:yes gene_type:complete